VKTTYSGTVPPNLLTTIPVTPQRPGAARAAHPGATTWHPARPAPVVRRWNSGRVLGGRWPRCAARSASCGHPQAQAGMLSQRPPSAAL